MRISDWSSDVCSSDLHAIFDRAVVDRESRHAAPVSAASGLVTPARVDLVDLAHHRVEFGLARLPRDRGHEQVALMDRDHFVRNGDRLAHAHRRSEEHTSELPSLMRNSYAVFCLKKKTVSTDTNHLHNRPS